MLLKKVISLGEIAAQLSAKLIGSPDTQIEGLATLQTATSGRLSFLSNPVYKKYLSTTNASAVLLNEEVATEYLQEQHMAQETSKHLNLLVMDNPYLGYAKLSALFDTAYDFVPGVHTRAVIADTAVVPASCFVGANAVIEDGVTLGESVYIGANTVVGRNCKIADGARLWANVTLYSGVKVGLRTIVHSGAVIGSDGFGNAQHDGNWVKIAQLGGVTIGDDVEIGSNTSIDCGALEDTVIGNGVKIDNLVQIAHNVHIGDHTAVAGCVGIAGSTVVGKHCIIGGGTGVAGHIEIADKVAMTGMTMVTKSITQPGLYSSGTGVEPNAKWRKTAVRLRNLDDLFKRLKNIEKKLGL
jgi:UDP-3-O-[3-hydroxymyristoyl] glucosamine N-acyltransferase